MTNQVTDSVEAARALYAHALAEKDAQVRATSQAGREAARAVWQAWADQHNPAALRAAVLAAEAALTAAADDGDPTAVTAALTEVARSSWREVIQLSLEAEALGAGADIAVGPSPSAPDGHTAGGLAGVIWQAAHRRAQAEREAINAAAAAAARQVTGGNPCGWRVERSAPDGVDHIGGRNVEFRGGAATVMRADFEPDALAAMVRYWRSLPAAYTLIELFVAARDS